MTQHLPLIVRPELIGKLRAIQTEAVRADDARATLGELLQSALQLEFATIPPYLSAAFSLHVGNEEIRQLIMRIAKEEMLHFAAVANIMNAIGVTPNISAAIPIYPYNFDLLAEPFEINLQSFSLDQLEQVFMRIETPEDPKDFPKPRLLVTAPLEDEPETIGQFYEDIIDIIKSDVVPDLFIDAEQNLYKQRKIEIEFQKIKYMSNSDDSTYPLDSDIDFVIKDKNSAVSHLSWVVDQGEGAAPYDPLSAEGIPGHYYRFESILKGRYLVKDEAVEDLGYSFSGGDLPFDETGVHEFDANAKAEDYEAHFFVNLLMGEFNDRYSQMVDHLQTAFSAQSPDEEEQAAGAYEKSIGNMRSMIGAAADIINEARAESIKAGIPFQYRPGSVADA